MKILVMIFGLLFSTVAFGDRVANMGETDRCAFWARNAMYGATQNMRGAARDVEFINRTTLVELLKDGSGIGREKLYILIEEQDTDADLGFLEDSTLFGYDAMSIWKARNAELQPVRDEWRQHFLASCLDHTAI